ncbi:MAG: phosphoribosyl-ATP diphosphatase [Aggregatilineales bacterium]
MANILDQLQATILDRKRHPRPDSYTNKLFEAGRGRIAQKVGEEAVEVIVASLEQDREAQIGEFCDLLYHTLVLMSDLDITLDEVLAELERRHRR